MRPAASGRQRLPWYALARVSTDRAHLIKLYLAERPSGGFGGALPLRPNLSALSSQKEELDEDS